MVQIVALWQSERHTNHFLGPRGPEATIPAHGHHSKITTGDRFGIRAAGVMSRFGYLRDTLFLVAASGYAVNRWLLQSLLPSPFLHGHLNDLLLIPAALPVVLWLQRLAGLRKDDVPPSWMEMAGHLAVWSVICEFIGPFWLHHGTADLWDVAAYAVGGAVACLWWNRSAQPRSTGTL